MSERRFQITNVRKSAQKNITGKKKTTTFSKEAVYTGNPQQAAKKAFSNLCRGKSIRGQCAINVTIQEIGPGKKPLTYKTSGNVKEHSYSFRRKKLKEPKVIEFDGKKVVFKYDTVVRKTN